MLSDLKVSILTCNHGYVSNPIVPPQGDEFDAKFIPGGTAVGWNLLPMLREARLWGRDPEIFRPQQLSGVDNNARASRERVVELLLGYGRFACAGKTLAQMELHKFYFEVSCPISVLTVPLCETDAVWKLFR